MSNDYVLVTDHKTVLDVNDNGDFVSYIPVSLRSRPRLILDATGRMTEALPDGNARRSEIERLGPTTVAFRVAGSYVCAEIHGGTRMSSQCAAWETFHLVPIETAFRLATRDLTILFPVKPRAFRIAKIIHQTSKSAQVPSVAEENVDRLRALNPGWDYRYWSHRDAHDFIYGHFGWDVLEAYLRINPSYGAARADLFRYLLIYQSGGVYLDMKSTATRPLDDILRPEDEFLLSHWTNGWGFLPELEDTVPGGEYQNWHVIGTAGHKFLEAVIERVLRNIRDYDSQLDGVGKAGVFRVTGPLVYTTTIHPLRARHAHRLVNQDEVGLVFEGAPRPEGSLHYSVLRSPVVS